MFKTIAGVDARRLGCGRSLPRGFLSRAVAGPALRVRLLMGTEISRRADDANGFANEGRGALRTDLDGTAVHQQIRGRSWTTVDAPDLATDQVSRHASIIQVSAPVDRLLTYASSRRGV
jgi:hypothetical protein